MPEPVAGVRTKAAVYMDPGIPATIWTAQSQAARSAVFFLIMLGVLLLLIVPARLSRS